MKYYSEKLNKIFDSEDELKDAEAEKEKEEQKKSELATRRKERADEIKDAYDRILSLTKDYNKQLKELQDFYNKLVKDFVKDYGSYHYSYHTSDVDDIDALSTYNNAMNDFKFIFNSLFNW